MFLQLVLYYSLGTKVTFNILIDRSGSYLFTKLFGGSFFAFVISWLTFFIPRKEFDDNPNLVLLVVLTLK